MPVLSLPTFKSRDLSVLANLSLEGSPTRPPEDFSNPVCITPPRNVPVVKITALAKYSSPEAVETDFIEEPCILKSSTEPSVTVRLVSERIKSCIACL